MKTAILRDEFKEQLQELNPVILPKDHTKISVLVDINPRTVKKYFTGVIVDIEVAERIIIAANEVLAEKALQTA